MNGSTQTHRGWRRVLGLGLGSAMIVALAPGVASAQTQPEARSTDNVCFERDDYDRDHFDDTRGSAHERNILCMADHGLTEGLRGGDRYGPRLDVKRGQMASFIARFIEDYTGEELQEGGGFDDVDSTYAHAENINKLEHIGVAQGTQSSNGERFAPLDDVTRAQMASFISRALTYIEDDQGRPETVPPRTDADYFSDDDGSVHEENVDALADVGIVAGFADGTYGPGLSVKRDQMASFVMRAYDYAVEATLGFDYVVPMTWEEETGGGETGAEGLALLGINEDTNTIDVMAFYDEVTGPFGDAPGFHIHAGARGTDGPIVVTLATGADLDEGDGFYWAEVDAGSFDVGLLLTSPEAYYLNLHSNDHPDGAIRGQLAEG